MSEGTAKPIELLKSGLCREQYAQLKAQLLKAKEYGTIPFGVEFRNFDYRQWYKDWTEEPKEQVRPFFSYALPILGATVWYTPARYPSRSSRFLPYS